MRPTRPSYRWATTCSPPAPWWRPSRWTPRTRAPTTTSAATSRPRWWPAATQRSTTSRATRCPARRRASSRGRGRHAGRLHDALPSVRVGVVVGVQRAARDHGYWRDVGTLDAYYDAHKDLISVQPIFNLYNDRWPILTWHEPLPPAKFV